MDIQELKEFLKDQSPPRQTSKSAVRVSNGSRLYSSLPSPLDLARVKPDPDACLPPDLSNPIKKEHVEDMLDLSDVHGTRSDASQHAVRTRQIKEGGKELILILDSDSDSEGEDIPLPGLRDGEDGMSSDTAVGDSNFGDNDIDSLAEDDDDGPAVVNFSDSESSIDPMSDIEIEPTHTIWLDDGLTSRVSNKPCKVTRQRSVERVEYLNDIPSYWPIPEVYVAYVLDLSDPKFDIKNKDGDLLPVDTLICDKVSKKGFN